MSQRKLPLLEQGSPVASVLVTVSAKLIAKILSGQKRVEFRKVWPRTEVREIWFCEKGRGGVVAAKAEVVETVVTDALDAWRRFGEASGVGEFEFFNYAGSRQQIYCVALTNAETIRDTFVRDLGVSRPPQNYTYIDP
ncbi:hypothetical protein R69927_00434 [Paraburkholderia domus]|uniref:ASCH domain-containing protein n=1 Tax=Paraburkholderia domus TaxID=2793075 RepID=UPI001913ECE6|nr:ASCH domain-containing protein [Paraburkholderia domus]MBK5084609.1 ASCH domain-containing protein [Burkholderia sp. R-69927]CAE6816121.1 hypothetical protein R69927_00434 [Paraburkholderia domus]